MEKIRWGMIGCGEVTEMKSGPAFSKVPMSAIVAVMSRNREKVRQYAQRHHISKYYTGAGELLSDPEINAVYIATPPSSHEEYAIAAMAAGKHVYLEKPMALDHHAAVQIEQAATRYGMKLSIAHYRREQPLFKKVKELLVSNAIGQPVQVNLELSRELITPEEKKKAGVAWRLDPAVSGGGLFHDIAPHQLDLLRFFFGEVMAVTGSVSNTGGAYEPPDKITAKMEFRSGVFFSGKWDFNASGRKDHLEILGTKGKISFGVFQHLSFLVSVNGKEEEYRFDPVQHAQQPMIGQVVQFFLGKSYNPCTGADGVAVMRIVEQICNDTSKPLF